MVRWLKVCASSAESKGSIPGWEARIPCVVCQKKPRKKFKYLRLWGAVLSGRVLLFLLISRDPWGRKNKDGEPSLCRKRVSLCSVKNWGLVRQFWLEMGLATVHGQTLGRRRQKGSLCSGDLLSPRDTNVLSASQWWPVRKMLRPEKETQRIRGAVTGARTGPGR